MESEWEIDRIKLYQLRREHPDWTLKFLAQKLKRSLSWVKKWLKRFREAAQPDLEMFQSRSRAPHHRPRQVCREVREAILGLRDTLKEMYGRVVGAKTILYHLHRDSVLLALSLYLPRSTRTIWKILRDGGRIPIRTHETHPLERPEPMQHWEIDFGEMARHYEFFAIADRGTSIMVGGIPAVKFNAESVLYTLAQLLILIGMPQKIRCDNDTRFVGSWRADKYPSPLMRFLACLGIIFDPADPGKPYLKPFVERLIRTLKYECLWLKNPENEIAAAEVLDDYRAFYNAERANQSLACGNRPPYEAFPKLPNLPRVPDWVDPDLWLESYHRAVFERRVGQSGSISVGNHSYYVDYRLAGETIGVNLDAQRRVFNFLSGAKVIRQVEIQGLIGHKLLFGDYLKQMLVEARTEKTE